MAGNLVFHDFYCINCGNKSMELARKKGHQHGRFHRKKLYCPICRVAVNHIECKNDEDVYEFKLDFENGEFTEEAKESIELKESITGLMEW